MSRFLFGVSPADWAFTAGAGNTAVFAGGATITAWNAQTGGSQYTDLAADAAGASHVSTWTTSDGTDGLPVGQLHPVYGPDGVVEMWLSANGGPRLLFVAVDAAQQVKDAVDQIVSSFGAPNGLATLGSDGKVKPAQLPGTLGDSINLSNLADVVASTPNDGDVLSYSASNSDWISGPPQDTKGLRSLLTMYAPPNVMNGKFDNDYAAGILAQYDDVVLGDGLEDPSGTYYASTVAILGKLQLLNPKTVVWGYVNAGVLFGNLTLDQIRTDIDQWVALGAKGIFLDLFGYDFQTDRTRQSAILDYVHSRGLKAFLNVFNPDDAFSSAVDATYNPAGDPTHAQAGDVVLLESWVFNSDAIPGPPYWATMSDIKARGDKAVAYRESLGIRVYASSVMLHTGTPVTTLNMYRAVGEGLARIWRLDGWGVAASQYSATGTDAGVAIPYKSPYPNLPQRNSGSYHLNGAWTQVSASDLGITIDFDASTTTYDWHVDGAFPGTSPLVLPFSVTGTLTIHTGQHRLYNDTGNVMTLEAVRASVGTAPAGSGASVQVKKNGTSVLSSDLTIAAGSNTQKTNTFADTVLHDGDYLTVDVTAVGSTTAGSDLTVQVLAVS